jgi:two-component system, OmpR family, phosphate regulon sensor histidine kinase PhoR
MNIRTAEDKTAVLEALLHDARIEANQLRARLERFRRIMASTRLVMGHEIRRPTTAIAGYLEVARDDVAKAGLAEATAFIDKAREECELLDELNTFFLDLLKVDGAVGMPPADKVDIVEVIDEAIEHLPRTLGARARVRIVVGNALPPAPMNRNALKMIVLNLIENALNYSSASTMVRIEAEVGRDQRGPGDRDLLKLRVIDQGEGIAPEDVKRIFMPFVRLEEGKTRGSGLGLTLVRSLVDMCDGEVSVRSEAGKGTTVFVTLPLSPGGEPEVVRP